MRKGKIRDYQKKRIYDSENAIRQALTDLGLNKRLESVEEVEAFVRSITRSRFWKSAKVLDTGPRGKPVAVRDGRGRRIACGGFRWDIGYYIALPKWARTPLVIVHETAHVATYRFRPGHGRAFARTFLWMTTRFIGKEAGALLLAEFKKRKVRRTGFDSPRDRRRPVPGTVQSVASNGGETNVR